MRIILVKNVKTLVFFAVLVSIILPVVFLSAAADNEQTAIFVGDIKSVMTDSLNPIFFSFTPSESGEYTFYSVGAEDTYGILYDSNMKVLFRDDDSGDGSNFSITYNLTAGFTYIYAVRPYEGSSLTFDVCLIARGAGLGNSGRCGPDVSWTLDEYGALRISGTGETEGFSASETPFGALGEKVKTVVIENGVTGVGERLFYGCSSLYSVTLPDSVKTIGARAFFGCTSLYSIVVPAGVLSIGEYALGYTGGEGGLPVKTEGFSIVCSEGTAAHTYSKDNGFLPEDISDCVHEGLRHIIIAATCISTGEEYDVCDLCKETFNRVQIPVGEHLWDDGTITVEATCTSKGIKVNTCTVCKTTSTLELTAGHSYKSVVFAPTCVEPGYTLYTCTVCNESRSDNRLAALGHSWGSPETATAATCTQSGAAVYTCTACGQTERRETAASGHSYNRKSVAATCLSGGYTINTCSKCGDSYTDNLTEPSAHVWDSGSVTTEASCTENGRRVFTCVVCGKTEDKVIASTGHEYKTDVIAPTCTKQGYTLHTCLRCGDSRTDSYTGLAEHLWNGGAVTTEATCTQDGLRVYSCLVCNQSQQRKIDAAGHSWGDAIQTKEATCTEDGRLTFTCKACSLTKTQELPAAGHDFAESVKEPTCTQGGYTLNTCRVCGESNSDKLTAALGHSWDKEEIVTPATCTQSGRIICICSVCEETVTRDIEAAGHDYASAVIAATCIKGGYTCYTCAACGDSYTDTPTPAAEHLDVNSDFICDTCGKSLIEVKTVTGLKASPITSDSLTLTWDELDYATGYRVYKYNAGTKKYEQYRDTDESSLKVDGLPANSPVYFKIQAYRRADGKTVWGDVSGFYRTYTSPAKVTGLRFSSTSTSVKLLWNATAGATGYRIYKYNPLTKKYEAYKALKDTTFTLTGLEANSVVYFKVRAYRTISGANYWGTASDFIRTFSSPAKITGLRVSAYYNNRLKLVWNKTAGATGYTVYKYNPHIGKYEICRVVSSNTFTVGGLDAAAVYYFKVRAYRNISGINRFGDLSDFLKTSTCPENGVLSSAASSAAGKLTVKWTKTPGAAGYAVQYSVRSDFSAGVTTRYTASQGAVYSGLSSGRTYYVRIRPYIISGNTKIYSAGYSPAKSVKIR